MILARSEKEVKLSQHLKRSCDAVKHRPLFANMNNLHKILLSK